MKIAIHAADLDHKRIDGTRVYLLNMLNNFGLIKTKNEFDVYHHNQFNPELTPPIFPNYIVKKAYAPFFWTQTCFAWRLFWDKPDVLWMPVHNIPIFRRKSLKVVVTIHDLAFKIFPEYFPQKDLKKLNRLSDLAIKNADRIIAVSDSTKNDILKFYPEVLPENVVVVHHGFDTKLFSSKIDEAKQIETLSRFKIQDSKFVLYVGAIQPRKNLEVLIEAFDEIKKKHGDLKLVFAGAPAWNHEGVFEKIQSSEHRDDIVVTGILSFEELRLIYGSAKVFVFPSLYEGFGIPVLEAFASDVPAILADNSSLPEVAGNAALYFKTGDSSDLAVQLERVLGDEALRQRLISAGRLRAQEFSWSKCAKQTLDNITKW
ncbi:MAG: glycosyltransferase family 1 protein [bacterium]